MAGTRAHGMGAGWLAAAMALWLAFAGPATAQRVEGDVRAALAPTGYLTFVKICELVGALLVAIPRTRNLGLLVLGPIILNILAFHTFITAGVGLSSPMLIVICLLAVYLLWVERRAFLGLYFRSSSRERSPATS